MATKFCTWHGSCTVVTRARFFAICDDQELNYNKIKFPVHLNFHWKSLVIWVPVHILLTHWGQVTHIYVGNVTIVASDNGLLPWRHQAIIWTNARILSTGPLETNFSGILFETHTFAFKKMHLKMSSGKWWPFSRGLNVLNAKRTMRTRHALSKHLWDNTFLYMYVY